MNSRKGMLGIALVALGTSASLRAAAPSIVQTREVLTNRAIVTLAAAGFNEDFLIELILNGRTQFDTSVDGLAGLAKQGINERIIRVMLNTPVGVPAPLTGDMKPSAAPDQEAKSRIAPLTPKPGALDSSTHTPHCGSISMFWGLFKRSTCIDASPEAHDH